MGSMIINNENKVDSSSEKGICRTLFVIKWLNFCSISELTILSHTLQLALVSCNPISAVDGLAERLQKHISGSSEQKLSLYSEKFFQIAFVGRKLLCVKKTSEMTILGPKSLYIGRAVRYL